MSPAYFIILVGISRSLGEIQNINRKVLLPSTDVPFSGTVRIIHTGNIMSQFDEFEPGVIPGGKPPQCRKESKVCHGGIPRMFETIKKLKEEVQPGTVVLVIDSGNLMSGTSWFKIHGTEAAQYYHEGVAAGLPSFQYIAALGRREFEVSPEHAAYDYIRTTDRSPKFVRPGNMEIDCKHEDPRALCKTTVPGVDYGIGGFNWIPTTSFMDTTSSNNQSNIGEYKLNDEVETTVEFIKERMNERSKNNYCFYIVYGNAHPFKLIEMLKKLPNVPVVVLAAIDHGEIFGESYPATDRLVVSSSFGESIGYVDVKFRKDSKDLWHYESQEGHQILLNMTLKEAVPLKFAQFKKSADRILSQPSGFVNQTIDGVKCHMEECAVGNLVTDAVQAFLESHHPKHNIRAVVWHGHSIRHSLKHGNITVRDIDRALPQYNTISIMKVSGEELVTMFRASGKDYYKFPDYINKGWFLQVSKGLKIEYSPDRKRKGDLKLVEVNLLDRESGKFVKVDRRGFYVIAIPTILINNTNSPYVFLNLSRVDIGGMQLKRRLQWCPFYDASAKFQKMAPPA